MPTRLKEDLEAFGFSWKKRRKYANSAQHNYEMGSHYYPLEIVECVYSWQMNNQRKFASALERFGELEAQYDHCLSCLSMSKMSRFKRRKLLEAKWQDIVQEGHQILWDILEE